MKRKKWSEVEEQTLLSKYNDLKTSGSLSKLKTREKKFRPIADHVNAVHHLQDSVAFPFKWSWRDVSIKFQNMRHQYIGVKQKIRVSKDEFNWKDGEHHWENFLRYKEVFGDVELLNSRSKKFFSFSDNNSSSDLFRDCGDLGLGFDSDDLEEEDDDDDELEEDGDQEEGEDEDLKEGESNCDDGDDEDMGSGDDCNNGEDQDCEFGGKVNNKRKKGKLKGVNKRLGLLGAQVVELKDMVVRREEKRREREFDRETRVFQRKQRTQSEDSSKLEDWEMELEEREMAWGKRKLREEIDLVEKRRKMREMEEKREKEEMEWREKVMRLQIEHEKLMMQIQAEACQNQIQILGVMARLVCSIYGAGGSDGLGGSLGGLAPHQVMGNLQQHSDGGLGGDDNGKPDSSSPSEFL